MAAAPPRAVTVAPPEPAAPPERKGRPATADNLGVSTTAPVPVTEATWLVQASTTEPFSMACSTEGTLNLNNNGPSTLQLAKVTGPLACPGTPITNNSLDLTADWP